MENQSTDSLAENKNTSSIQQATTSKTSRYLIILVATLVVAVGLIYYFYKTVSPTNIETVIEEISQEAPSGTIILTATLGELPAVFTLDLETEGALFYEYPSDYEITAFPEFTDKINSEKVFFVGSTEDASAEVDKIGLHSWFMGKEGVQYYSSAAGNTERDLNWSQAANKIAFYRVKDTTEISEVKNLTIDDYEIVILDPDKNVVVGTIQDGIYPRWSPTGESLLYLKKDGIYEFNLSSNTETKIHGPDQVGAVITPSEMLDVSPGGSKLIVTSQNTGLITMFDIVTWNPLVLEVNHTYADETARFSGPQFSPDSSKYALLTFDKRGEEFFDPRLEIRDSKTAEVMFSRPVDAFDMRQFFISDWVADIIANGPQFQESETDAIAE